MTIATALTWEQMPGLAREISLGADGSGWCLGMGEMPSGGYSIHRWNGADWDHIDGAAVRIAVGRGVGFQPATSVHRTDAAVVDGLPDLEVDLWVIHGDHEVLRHSPAGWELLPGRAREVAVGANGAAWCLSAADFAPGGGSIHIWNGRDWDHVDGAAVKIAVGPDEQPWIINSAGQIFRRSGQGWELLPGLAREIAIGVDGMVWCLSAATDSAGESSIHFWNGSDWDHVPGAAVKVSAGAPGAVWLVNSQHQIFRAA
jgi:hypothetical protein